MDEATRQERLRVFEQTCRDRGLPVTVQRRTILEAVLDAQDHPSADRVNVEVARRTPGISRATVYRTLETLVRMGIITRACHPGRGVRYDNRLEIHHHLVCLRCDTMIDISDPRLDALPIPDTSAEGFEVSDHRVQLRGLCRSCRELEEES